MDEVFTENGLWEFRIVDSIDEMKVEKRCSLLKHCAMGFVIFIFLRRHKLDNDGSLV